VREGITSEPWHVVSALEKIFPSFVILPEAFRDGDGIPTLFFPLQMLYHFSAEIVDRFHIRRFQ
jgi:hypothetical protein